MSFDRGIPVTYSGGAFHPDEPTASPEGVRGSVSISDEPTPGGRRRAWESIQRIRREKLIRLSGPRLTRDELYDRG